VFAALVDEDPVQSQNQRSTPDLHMFDFRWLMDKKQTIDFVEGTKLCVKDYLEPWIDNEFEGAMNLEILVEDESL